MKDQKGITLIALVITIIVLLILAGVAIAMLSGDNGILNKASESAEATKIGEVKDEIGLTIYEAVTAYLDKTYNSGEVPTEVSSYIADAKSVSDVVKNVLKSYSNSEVNGVEIKHKENLDDTHDQIAIQSEKYYVTGKIDKTTGAVEWDKKLTKGTYTAE